MTDECYKEPCQELYSEESCTISDFILSIKVEPESKLTILWECLRCGANGATTLDHVLWANTGLTIGVDVDNVSLFEMLGTVKLLNKFLRKHSINRNTCAGVQIHGGSRSGESEDLVITEIFVNHRSGCG